MHEVTLAPVFKEKHVPIKGRVFSFKNYSRILCRQGIGSVSYLCVISRGISYICLEAGGIHTYHFRGRFDINGNTEIIYIMAAAQVLDVLVFSKLSCQGLFIGKPNYNALVWV